MAAVNRPNAPQDYRTPPEFLAAVVRRFGPLEWDAACTSANCIGSHGGYHYDRGLDALTRDWNELGSRMVWDNPPWALAGRFAAKHAARNAGPSLLLCQLAADSAWYAKYVHGRALVLACRPRIPFLAPCGTKPAFVDPKTGKALGVNRPAMLACYGLGVIGFEPWRWDSTDDRT